jgi:hypothetical protein
MLQEVREIVLLAMEARGVLVHLRIYTQNNRGLSSCAIA